MLKELFAVSEADGYSNAVVCCWSVSEVDVCCYLCAWYNVLTWIWMTRFNHCCLPNGTLIVLSLAVAYL